MEINDIGKDILNNTRGMTLRDIIDNKSKKEVIDKVSNVEVMLSESRVRADLEKKAYVALDNKLTPRIATCPICEGGKFNHDDDKICRNCKGSGVIHYDSDMAAIKLVLDPKFPKTNINITADIDNMTTKDLLDMIDRIT